MKHFSSINQCIWNNSYHTDGTLKTTLKPKTEKLLLFYHNLNPFKITTNSGGISLNFNYGVSIVNTEYKINIICYPDNIQFNSEIDNNVNKLPYIKFKGNELPIQNISIKINLLKVPKIPLVFKTDEINKITLPEDYKATIKDGKIEYLSECYSVTIETYPENYSTKESDSSCLGEDRYPTEGDVC